MEQHYGKDIPPDEKISVPSLNIKATAIIRVDTVLNRNREELEEKLSEIYPEMNEAGEGNMTTGEHLSYTTYYGEHNIESIDEFESMETRIYYDNTYVLDVVTLAEFDKTSIDGVDEVRDLQVSLNDLVDEIPTIASKYSEDSVLSDNHVTSVLAIYPEEKPIIHDRDGNIDPELINDYISENSGKLSKYLFTSYDPISYVETERMQDILLSTQDTKLSGPYSAIIFPKSDGAYSHRGRLHTEYIQCLLPYFRRGNWGRYRFDNIGKYERDIYQMDERLAEIEDNENLIHQMEEYRDIVNQLREDWTATSQAMNEKRSLRNPFEMSSSMGDDVKNELLVPAQRPPMYTVVSGKKILKTLEETSVVGFARLDLKMENVEEKQNKIKRHIADELSAQSTIQSLKLQRKVQNLTYGLVVLTVVLVILTLLLLFV